MTAVVTEAQQSGLTEDEFFTLVREVWQSVQLTDGFKSKVFPRTS
jgi:hypothetical protein